MAVRSLRQVMYPISDLAVAVEFYRDTMGLPLVAEFDPPGLAFFDLDGVRLLLEQSDAVPSSGTIYLSVENVDAETERLRSAGVPITGEPHLIHRDDAGVFGAPGTEDWMSFVVDPFGNTIGLSERRVAPTD